MGAADLFKEGLVARGRQQAEPLTDEQIAAENEFLKGLPRINWGAFLMPAIWGPAHGIWIAIIFYPLWLIADNVFYLAWVEPSPIAIVIAISVFAIMFGITLGFAIVSQPFAAHRAENMGVSRETYLRRERWWILISAIIGIAFIVLATVYNITIRPTMEV